MADSFLSTDTLIDTLSAHSFDRPPALVSNAHITGVSVARALSAHDIPVIALDRNGDGVAPPSNAIDFAGEVTFPLTDLDGFRTDVEAIVDAAGGEAVAFGCMDEWVHAYAESEPEGVHLPFAAYEIVDRVLDKSSLYRIADELGVPYPETYWLDETDVDEAVDALSFPLVVKPALKREFEEAFGTNVVEVADRKELDSLLAEASGADIEVLLQERVPIVQGKDRSLASYVPPATENPAVGDVADALAVVGNARVRYPQAFGTSCVVDQVSHPEIEARALAVLAETGYYGISEAEFVYDGEREEYVLLDINTRPWKWISMPVAAGANLPLAAYADAVSDDSLAPSETPIEETRWVYLRDYLSLLATDDAFWDVLSDAQWQSLVSGSFEDTAGVTTGVYRPSDPAPAVKLINTEFTDREYYCSC